MIFTATSLPYQQTGYFSKIISDYLDGSANLRPFYHHPVSLEGIKSAIQERKQFPTDRNLLVRVLKQQYEGMDQQPAVLQNLELLKKENCFTITTAHQPAIFTGSLYFIYKILHAIKLVDHLTTCFPAAHFVPVFYMGSEDADLDELGKIFLDQEALVWDTKQTGAVGRMKTKGLEKILARIEGEYSVKPFGSELLQLLKDCYGKSENIQAATFKLIHALFASRGLVVLIPDHPDLKRAMIPVFEDDLFSQTPSSIVEKSIASLSEHYKVQAKPREINLFYLKDDLRGRIEKTGDTYTVHESKKRFTKDELQTELALHPDRFSPNVILRGLFQETLLPNIVFIGGGGETAYWLELKALFDHYRVPYPLLILRNSFLLIEKKWKEKLSRTGLSVNDIFTPVEDLFNKMVKKESKRQLDLAKELAEAQQYYEHVRSISLEVDPTLSQHVEALQAKALKPLKELEKKLLKAEKRKFEERKMLLFGIKSGLFPINSLQERIENFMPYYAAWGTAFLDLIYAYSFTLEQQFVVLEEGS
jgi:bacillithiol synthase